jgi:site-specific DNA recombinase
VYYGVFHAYRLRKTDDKRDVRRPKEDWVGVPVPAIISRELWDAAQQGLARGKALSPRNSQAGRYLLRRRMRYVCGYAWVGDFRYGMDTPYYVCSGRNKSLQRVHRCDLPYIHGPRFDAQVWDWLESEILDEEALRIGLRQYQERAETAQAEVRHQLALLQQQSAQIRSQGDKLLDLYLTEGIDRLRYDARRAELTATSETLTHEIQTLEAKTGGLTDEEVASLHAFAQAIRDELRDLSDEERRRVVDRLDVRVMIRIEDEQPVADVRCRLSLATVPVRIDTSVLRD